MAVAGQRQYSAVFAIGARFMSSFKGVMAQAQARLHRLNAAAIALGRNVLKFATIFGGLSAFGAGTVLSQIFEGANEAAEELDTTTRRITEAFMTHVKMQKLGRDMTEQVVQKIYKYNEALSQQGVISKQALDATASMLALQGLSPKKIVGTLRPLSDMLVATKGIAQAQAMLPDAAFAFGKAIRTGMARPLFQFGLSLTKPEQQILSQKAKVGDLEGAYKFLMKMVVKYSGASARALKTPEGRIHALANAIGDMRERIGEASLESRARMSDAWLAILPRVEPILIKLKVLSNNAMRSIAEYVKRVGIPAFKEFEVFLKGPLGDALNRLKAAWTDMVSNIGPAFAQMMGRLTGSTKSFQGSLGDILIGALNKLSGLLKSVGNNASWLVPLVTALVPAFYAFSAAVGVANVALALTPVGWLIMGLAAIGAGLVYLKLQFGSLENARNAFWNWLKQIPVLGSVIQWWNKLAATMTGLLGGYWNALTQNWNSIRTAFETAKPILVGVFKEIGSAILEQILMPIHAIQTAWSSSIDFIKRHMPSFGGVRPSVPTAAVPQAAASAAKAASKIPGMATGGIIRGHSLLQIAERGPEAVIPLSGGPRARGLLDYASRAIGVGGATNNGGDTHITIGGPQITIHGNASETEQRSLASRLQKYSADLASQLKSATRDARRLSFESGYA
jgi:hypothetical protein